MIWSPMVCTGESELIGSWKIMPMRPPRIARTALPRGSSAVRSISSPAAGRKRTCPSFMTPGRGTMFRMVRAVTDLPDPDSPTMAVVLLR